MGFEVRSSDLETGSSSSASTAGLKQIQLPLCLLSYLRPLALSFLLHPEPFTPLKKSVL